MIGKWLQDTIQQWRQNQRLRYAVLIVLVILAMHGILKLADRRDEVAKNWAREQELALRLQEVAAQPAWLKRANSAGWRARQTVASLPLAATPGQARADLQVWLAELAKQHKLAAPQIKVEPALEVPKFEGMLQVVGRLETSLNPWDIGAVIRDMSNALPWRQVQNMEFTGTTPSRLVIIIKSYYRTPELVLPALPQAADKASAPGAAAKPAIVEKVQRSHPSTAERARSTPAPEPLSRPAVELPPRDAVKPAQPAAAMDSARPATPTSGVVREVADKPLDSRVEKVSGGKQR